MTSENGGSCTVIKSNRKERYEEDEKDVALLGGYQSCSCPPPPITPPRRPHMPNSTPKTSSPEGPLNWSSNILLVYRLHEMRHIESVNFNLAIACLIYWCVLWCDDTLSLYPFILLTVNLMFVWCVLLCLLMFAKTVESTLHW